MRQRSFTLARLIAAASLVVTHAALGQNTKITLDSVLKALSAGDSAINFAQLDPARHKALDSIAVVFHDLRVTDLTVDDFASAASARAFRFLDIFRWDREKAARAAQPALKSALFRLQQITLPEPNGLGPRILAQLQRAGYDKYMGPMETLQTRVILQVQAASTEKLRRYEIKFGPSSHTLNPVETSINYLLERIPGSGFGPMANGPGPLEFVASYSSTEATANGGVKDLRLMSGAHVGLRVYTFDTTSAKSPLAQLVHPGSLAFGVSTFSPTDRPLDSPFRTGRRWGGFIDWDKLRVAAALGHDWRVMLGSGAHIIPHIL